MTTAYDNWRHKTTTHLEEPCSVGRWMFERSSGFAGWRCEVCATWIYNYKPLICSCDKDNREISTNYRKTT